MAFATIQEIQQILAQSFCGGDTTIAGIAMFSVVMMFVFLVFAKRNLMVGFILMFPLTMIFTSLGILSETLTVLLIVVAVIGIAKERRAGAIE